MVAYSMKRVGTFGSVIEKHWQLIGYYGLAHWYINGDGQKVFDWTAILLI